MILYKSDDDGTLYPASAVDEIRDDGSARGFRRVVVPDEVTLTAEQCCYGYGNIVELLLRAGQAHIIDTGDN